MVLGTRGTTQKIGRSLLYRYGNQLGQIVERARSEMALVVAKQEAENAALAAQDAMEAAQAADKSKSEFLANMSHELRTPLNAIIGFSDLMRQTAIQAGDLEKISEYATDINESGLHLLGIISDILDIAKIEAGKHQLDESAIDVSSAIEKCIKVVGPSAENAGVKLLNRAPDGLPAFRGDETKFKQTIINLLSNAVKFTDTGGYVLVEGETGPDGLVIAISDTGIGIEKDDIPRALSPFVQIDGATSKRYEGTGLGLPLSKALVELHDGTLTLQSKIGVGTRVTLRFPPARMLMPKQQGGGAPAPVPAPVSAPLPAPLPASVPTRATPAAALQEG